MCMRPFWKLRYRRRIGTWRGTLVGIRSSLPAKRQRHSPESFSRVRHGYSRGNSRGRLVGVRSDFLGSAFEQQRPWHVCLRPDRRLRGQSNTLNLSGLMETEGVNLNAPGAGTWRVSVRNTFGGLSTPQKFFGVVEMVARVIAMRDVSSLSPLLREDIYQSIRSFTMWPIGSEFRADQAVTRSDLATAMVLGGRLPSTCRRNQATRTFPMHPRAVCRKRASPPTGALFIDVIGGGQFRPADMRRDLLPQLRWCGRRASC